MQMIADACGVSRNAVSVALRGGGKNVSEATGARIRAKAEELGYTRDPELSRLARRLAQNKTKGGVRGEIPFLVPVPKGYQPESSLMYQGMCKDAARRMGYQLEPYFCGPDFHSPKRVQQIWRSRGIRGVLMFSPFLEEMTGEWAIHWDAFSWVLFSETMNTPMFHRINWDFKASVLVCYQKLREKGYRRIGLIMADGYDSKIGHGGTAATAIHHQYCKPTERVPRLSSNDASPQTKPSVIEKWVERSQPDAVIALDDVLPVIQRCSSKTNTTLGFASFRLEKEHAGLIAGVMPGFETLAKTAIELLVGQMDHNVKGIPKHPLLTHVEGEWMEGPTAPGI